MSAHILAEGPAMYFGGTIMTFALPYGAFIVIATALFLLFRAKHHGPKLKYLSPGQVSSVITREPGPVPAPAAKAAKAAGAPAAEAEAGASTADAGAPGSGAPGADSPEGEGKE